MKRLVTFSMFVTVFSALLIPAHSAAGGTAIDVPNACQDAVVSADNDDGPFANYEVVYLAEGDNGGPGSQVIIGTDGSDSIDGGSGNDFICGAGGADDIDGGSGHDVIFGNGGRDDLYGGSGNDDLFGGNGDDELFGESGNDDLDGGNDWNDCSGGSGFNTEVNCGAIPL